MLGIVVFKVMQVNMFKYLGNVLTDDRKRDIENRRRLRTGKIAIQERNKILKNAKN